MLVFESKIAFFYVVEVTVKTKYDDVAADSGIVNCLTLSGIVTYHRHQRTLYTEC